MNSHSRQPTEQDGPYGYIVQQSGPRSFDLYDAAGRARVRWTFPEQEKLTQTIQQLVPQLRPSHALSGESARLELLGPYPLPISMGNGKPNAKRRAAHNGWLQIGERRYLITHQFRYHTTMTRDGRTVARGCGRSPFRAPQLLEQHPADELDQLAIGLLWFLFTLGRTGVVSDIIAGASFI